MTFIHDLQLLVVGVMAGLLIANILLTVHDHAHGRCRKCNPRPVWTAPLMFVILLFNLIVMTYS